MQRISASYYAIRSLLLTLLLLLAANRAGAADTYSLGLLEIPTIVIGRVTYTNMLVTTGTVVSGPLGVMPFGDSDYYDTALNELHIPAVTAGNATYYNVVVGVDNLVSIGSASGADVFDGSELHISTVVDGAQAYTQVVVTIGKILSVAGGMPAIAQDVYDAASNQLTIPALVFGGRVYTNVTLTVANLLAVGGSAPVPVLQGYGGGILAGGPGYSLSLYGVGFVPGSVVLWNGSPLLTTSVSASGITAQVPANLIAVAGSVALTVSNAAVGGPVSAPEAYTVFEQSPPVLETLAPSAIIAGGPALVLTVNGANFTQWAVVEWNGSARPTTFVTSNQLTAIINPSDIATSASAVVTVSDPGSGFANSNALDFSVMNIVTPAVDQLVPSAVFAGGSSFILTVNGSGFANGAAIVANGIALPTSYQSPTVLTASVTAAQISDAGSEMITVANPPNRGGVSNAVTLDVLPREVDAVSYQINTGHSGYMQFASASLPTTRLWSVDVGSQPSFAVIAGGVVYVSTSSGEVIALNAMSGTPLWGPLASTGMVQLAYDAGTLFVLSGTISSSPILTAINGSNGNTLWSAKVIGNSTAPFPPVAAGGRVFVTGYEWLTAFDEAAGAQLWQQTPGGGAPGGSVAVTVDGVYVASVCNPGDLQPATGATVWEAGCDSSGAGRTAVVGSGRFYAPSLLDTNPGSIYASETGAQIGTFSGTTPPAVSPVSAFILSNGTLQSVMHSNGQMAWSFSGDGQLSTAPIVVNNFVFIGSSAGNLYALDATTGAVLGSTNLGAPIAGPGAGQSAFAGASGLSAGDGVLVVPAGNTVNAFLLSTNP